MEARKYPRFPLFLDLTGKPAVVVGGGPIALRRVETLLRFGAAVTVVSSSLARPVEGIRYVSRRYASGDLDGAFLAVAATSSRAVNRQIGADARALGIPVSVADCAEECTFFFPAVCQGGGLIAGVVSDGTDHQRTARAAKAIRVCLEGLE